MHPEMHLLTCIHRVDVECYGATSAVFCSPVWGLAEIICVPSLWPTEVPFFAYTSQGLVSLSMCTFVETGMAIAHRNVAVVLLLDKWL